MYVYDCPLHALKLSLKRDTRNYIVKSEEGKGETTFKWFTRVYYFILAVVWGIAFVFFTVIGSTDKSTQPHISRAKNEECSIGIWGQCHLY